MSSLTLSDTPSDSRQSPQPDPVSTASRLQQYAAYFGLGHPDRQTAASNTRTDVRNVVYLHWGTTMEAEYFQRIQYPGLPYHETQVIDCVDVSALWRSLYNTEKFGLDHVMHTWYGADTYKAKACESSYRNQIYALHNAGNDAYWQLRIFLEILTRHLTRKGEAGRRMALGHPCYGDVVFVCMDFEQWALQGSGPKHWQEMGISVLDTRTLRDRVVTDTKVLIKTHHFVHKLYDAQLRNCKFAVGAWCRKKCHPDSFMHGLSKRVHHDIAADVVKNFFNIPVAENAARFLEGSTNALVGSKKRNKGVATQEAGEMFGRGQRCGS